MENYRKSLIRNNRVKKISSKPDAVIRRATSGSRAIGSRPLVYAVRSRFDGTTFIPACIVSREMKALRKYLKISLYCRNAMRLEAIYLKTAIVHLQWQFVSGAQIFLLRTYQKAPWCKLIGPSTGHKQSFWWSDEKKCGCCYIFFV